MPLKVAPDRLMFWPLKCVGSRGPDGIRCSNDMRNIGKGITGVWSVLWQGCIFQMMYGLRIVLSTMNMASQTLDEVICDYSYEKFLSFHGHLH